MADSQRAKNAKKGWSTQDPMFSKKNRGSTVKPVGKRGKAPVGKRKGR